METINIAHRKVSYNNINILYYFRIYVQISSVMTDNMYSQSIPQ